MATTIPNMEEKAFAAWLERQLARREWTLADFARRLGIAPSIPSRWLSVRGRRPSPASCDLIADAFGMDVDEVLTLAGHRPRQAKLVDDDPRRAELATKLARAVLSDERYWVLATLLDGMRSPPASAASSESTKATTAGSAEASRGQTTVAGNDAGSQSGGGTGTSGWQMISTPAADEVTCSHQPASRGRSR